MCKAQLANAGPLFDGRKATDQGFGVRVVHYGTHQGIQSIGFPAPPVHFDRRWPTTTPRQVPISSDQPRIGVINQAALPEAELFDHSVDQLRLPGVRHDETDPARYRDRAADPPSAEFVIQLFHLFPQRLSALPDAGPLEGDPAVGKTGRRIHSRVKAPLEIQQPAPGHLLHHTFDDEVDRFRKGDACQQRINQSGIFRRGGIRGFAGAAVHFRVPALPPLRVTGIQARCETPRLQAFEDAIAGGVVDVAEAGQVKGAGQGILCEAFSHQAFRLGEPPASRLSSRSHFFSRHDDLTLLLYVGYSLWSNVPRFISNLGDRDLPRGAGS